MTLRIESNPDSQLILRSSFLKTYQLNYSKSATDCKSKLPSLKCEDSGIYQIQASNGIPYGDNITVNFKIYLSFPAPTVEWIRSTGFHWTVTKYGHDYKYKINSTIHIKTADDFGEYGIRICNRGEQLGCVKETITLTAEDRPEAPYNVSSETTTFGSVNLSWIAGFNGGDTQTFSVQFKTTDEDKWETKIVHTNETITGSRVYFSLNQLKPDTSYQVLVVSANKHGKRNVSLEFKTKVEPTLSLPSSASVSPLSIGIGCGIAVLVLTIILLVFIIRRNKTSKTESKECSVLYAEVDKEQQKSERRKPVKEDGDEPANGEYASVVKFKSKKVHYKEDTIETENNEYAIVDKSNKDFTENESVYANQDDEQLLPHKPLEAQSSGRNTNQDGLTYIEVSFTSNQSDRRPIIGAESKTDYVDIDFTRKADPLPDDSD
ncbi:unnamed protein product [Mytilus edulis]|uniref:Fibronectin type-III domain-containing protein n=1 Tax=Mytilus edulis TaxID=6550 RepID=A0A8S3R119_MYTED|nr:unnamed protein product [Mytilus edulis]